MLLQKLRNCVPMHSMLADFALDLFDVSDYGDRIPNRSQTVMILMPSLDRPSSLGILPFSGCYSLDCCWIICSDLLVDDFFAWT